MECMKCKGTMRLERLGFLCRILRLEMLQLRRDD